MILPLIDSVISERRAAFPKATIDLTPKSEQEAFGVFISANRIEIRSVISNLINNAVEATDAHQGQVTINVCRSEGNQIVIHISDNGSGIPNDRLPELGISGHTFGKKNGTGLGLFHAKQTVTDLGGAFKLSSQQGQGTTVTLKIPTAAAPDWFTSHISIPKDGDLAILDDNETIHDVWKYRLAKLSEPLPGLRVQHFRTTSELRNWHLKNVNGSKPVYLVDYEIRGDAKTGLDMIEELGIAGRSYLVTGHSDESHVLKRAEWLGVKVIPKGLAGTIPITSMESQ